MKLITAVSALALVSFGVRRYRDGYHLGSPAQAEVAIARINALCTKVEFIVQRSIP